MYNPGDIVQINCTCGTKECDFQGKLGTVVEQVRKGLWTVEVDGDADQFEEKFLGEPLFTI